MSIQKQSLSDEKLNSVVGGYMTGRCTNANFLEWMQSQGFKVNYGDENTPGYVYYESITTGHHVLADDEIEQMYGIYHNVFG